MPVFQDPDEVNIEQEICKDCQTNTVNQIEDEAVECDICQKWICFQCSGISREVYDFATEKEITVDYICKPCKGELPHIRDIVALKKSQLQISNKVDTEANINQRFRNEQITTNQAYEKRLAYLEKIVEDKNLGAAEYPPLPKLTEQAEKLKNVILQQATLDKKVKEQESTFTEQQNIAVKENSLIVYGIPEKKDDATEQMKEDFAEVKFIYNTKVTLNSKDLTQIIRVGDKAKADKDKKIRPIRLTFTNPTKRLEILRNNKNLRLEDEDFMICTSDFCEEKGSKHNHIYVSPDKTKKQRDEEKALRDELKKRRETEPDLIIRNGKIIKKTNRARWSDLIQDD